MDRKVILWGFILTVLAGLGVAQAQADLTGVPDDLAAWADWVKHDQGHHSCPHYADQAYGNADNHVCAWPQALNIRVDAQQADFAITWEVLQDAWVPLPGDGETWPQQVRANQRFLSVQNHHNQPRVWLTPGVYEISGQFLWATRPESIGVPSEVAAINLTLEDEPVRYPVRERRALWLGEETQEEQVEANSLDLEVNRLLIDGHPMVMFVALDLQVSGVARQENLGRVLSGPLQITDVSGDLNAHVDQAGDLWVQLKPGYSELMLTMNVLGWPESFTFTAAGPQWPQQEIWAYQDNKNIRLTQVEGVLAINPEQSSSRWFEVPNFLLNDGDEFRLVEQKRGTLNQSEQLHLARQAWLSFDGQGFRTKDRISGEKLGSWRLNAANELSLLSAESSGETLLITAADDGQQGVELRKPLVDLTIDGEIGPSFLQQISGWDSTFESVQTRLYLPHGYMALAAYNVDSSQQVWLEQWRLWDIFIVMLLTVLTFKVIGVRSAVFALLALVLGYHSLNMPLFAWGSVILALGLMAWIPQGRWLRLVQTYALLSVLALVFWLIPFLVNEARLMIHPQLENRVEFNEFSPSFAQAKKVAPLNQVYEQRYSADQVLMQNQVVEDFAVPEQGKITVTGSRVKRADMLNRYQTDAVIQAGKGTPQWQYNSVVLSWDGPITAEQSHRLVLLTPWMRVLWRLLLITFTVLWLVAIIQHMTRRLRRVTKTTATSLVWLMTLLWVQPSLAADHPSDALLNELKNRLYPTPECDIRCAALSAAAIEVNGKQLSMQLAYHTQAQVAVPIPDSADWQLHDVTVNGQSVGHRLQANGRTWLALSPGINQVVLSGTLANRNAISVRFPLAPGHVTTAASDWQVAGLDGQRLTGDTLQLIANNRPVNNETGGEDERTQTTDIAPFIKLERSITFDDQWFVDNTVTRVAPKQGVINLTIPLLENEFPLDKVTRDEAGAVQVNLGPNEQSLSWRSRLDRLDLWQITAQDSQQYIETWRVISSPQWHVNISGVPLVAAESNDLDYDDFFEHIYMPRPGESIEIKVSRPAAVAGAALSIDAINNSYTVGKRTTKTTTRITYRATQGGRFEVNLDPAAVVKQVTFDGVDSNLVNEDGVVAVSYLPGNHTVDIEWHVNQELGVHHQTPSINLNNPYSNLNQTINLPRDRWLLWGGSAGVGPAFLYWGELLVFVVLALFLARLKYSPLRAWQWLVLGSAFGTFSWVAFTWVAAWLFFVGWKQQFAGFASRAKRILLQWFSLLFTLSALLVLIGAVAYGLLSYPDMGIAGNGASASRLSWYVDVGTQQLPTITVLSLHLWWYKLLILFWSIWISFALLGWLKDLLQSLRQGDWWPRFKRPQKAADLDAAQANDPAVDQGSDKEAD
ncbi:hypothetical protein [Marinicella meishanensis]|uniref:hypothetical protein n=1 Tax=Marinicella meishanensis TaxID=2873263 RepID=UPI001CBC75B3|nr:hypothetical protein [Marinicella sp. NBU2979]